VLDNCTDLAREHEWNPKLRRAEKLTVDPIGIGTRFQAEFLKRDPMLIEYVGFDRARTLESVGQSRRLDARNYGRVSRGGVGRRPRLSVLAQLSLCQHNARVPAGGATALREANRVEVEVAAGDQPRNERV
jgi:hypothetical protein